MNSAQDVGNIDDVLDIAHLNKLKHDQPQIVSLLPRPEAPNGGVKWIPFEP